MPEKLSEIIALTAILQQFRNIYIVGMFAILGFVIQRKGYRRQLERIVISCAFLVFGLGNLFQIWQTSMNIHTLAKSSSFLYITPIQALMAHLPFDIAVFCILLFAFRVTDNSMSG